MGKPRRGRPPGSCTICQNEARSRAELLVAGGATIRAVSRKFSLSHDALSRHWKRHVSDERKAALVMGPVQIQGLAAAVSEESESVLDHHRATRAGLYKLYAAAVEASDGTTGALVAGRLTEVNNAIARLCGQLATSPLIQNTTNIAVLASPLMQQLQDMLTQRLRPHPEAFRAVIDGLRELSDQALRSAAPGASNAATARLPAIEVRPRD